jgi:uncharacterized peroxidase-related enzyme
MENDDRETPAMTRFTVPDIDELPADVGKRIDRVRDQSGFVPNIFLALSYRPAQFRPFFDYWESFTEAATLTREEIEMIVVTVSGINDCYYCNVSHGALLRVYGDDPELADQLFSNYRAADLGVEHQRMLELAAKLTERPGEITDKDLRRLREAGFSDGEIWDIGSLTAYVNLTNRLENFADIRPNSEFNTLGWER